MDFVSHQTVWGKLLQDVEGMRLPGAYLFYGLSGIGKRLIALHLAQYIGCVAQKRPCGDCISCQKMLRHQHPDVFELGSEEAIKIQALRDLKGELWRAPLECSLKMVILDEIHEMTHQAANSLLKILEEPPPQTLFILIAPNLFQVLATIRSRCWKIYFQAPSLLESKGLFDEKGLEVLQGTEGSIGMAKDILNRGLDSMLNDLSGLVGKEFSRISQGVSKCGEKSDALLLLELLKHKMIDRDLSEGTLEKIDLISKAQRDLDANVNQQLVLENLLGHL